VLFEIVNHFYELRAPKLAPRVRPFSIDGHIQGEKLNMAKKYQILTCSICGAKKRYPIEWWFGGGTPVRLMTAGAAMTVTAMS
jgi:hypothetical protein